jgi:hypothetical protein
MVTVMEATEECKEEVAEAKGSFFTDLWTVKLGDWERGLIVAVLAMPLGIVYDWATMEAFEFSWRAMVKAGVAGGLAYLLKNLGTGAKGRYLTNNS